MAAPPVQVPMNFGRHHIGSKTHSNMILNLKGGDEMKVSPLILSFNSPVIERLISTLEVASLDVDEFEESAVKCFVDCVYTGGIELLEMKVFKDVNKMAHVFEVEWLVGRCKGYFTECLSKYEHSDYDDELLVLVEGAWCAKTTLNKATLWNPLMEAVNYLGLQDRILSHYVTTMDTCRKLSPSQLDMLILIAGKRNDKLLKMIILDIHESQTLTENAGYLLQKLDVVQFMQFHKKLCCDLFTILNELDSLSKEDLKLVSKLQLDALKYDQDLQTTESTNRELQAGHIGYLFRPLEPIETDNFFYFHAQVSNKSTVRNFYTYIDYLFTWIENHQNSVQDWSEDWTKAICELKSKRRWKSIQREYVNSWGLSEEILKLLEHNGFFSKPNEAIQLYNNDKCKRWTATGIYSENRNKISVYDIMKNQEDQHYFSKFLRWGRSAKRRRTLINSEIIFETLPITTDEHSIQIRYSLKRNYYTENPPQENNQDFHLSISAICLVSDPEEVKNYNYMVRRADEKWPVSRKASLCELVKRPDMFGGGNVCKVRGYDIDNIVLTENWYLILALYD